MTLYRREERGGGKRGHSERGNEFLRCGAKRRLAAFAGKEPNVPKSCTRAGGYLASSPHSVGVHFHALCPYASALLLCLALLFAAPGQAQTSPAPTPIAGPPDVLVLVYQQPGGLDQVDITYARLVPHAEASADIDALTRLSGWPISSRRIKDAAAPMQNRTGAMTSVTFQVPGVVQDSSHTFPIETLARAFGRYRRLNAVFFVGPQFQFQGVRSYADNDIKVVLDQHDTAYAYQVEVLNQNFSRLSPVQAGAGGAARRSPWGILLGIAGLAVLAGLVVYFLAVRLTQPHTHLDETTRFDDAEAERLEAGAGK